MTTLSEASITLMDQAALSFAPKALVRDALYLAQDFFNDISKVAFKLPHGTGYCPYTYSSPVCERVYICLASFDPAQEEASIDEVRKKDNRYRAWIDLYRILRERAKQDFTLLNVPLGEFTLCISHFPPQFATNDKTHVDQSFLTYKVGRMFNNSRCEDCRYHNYYCPGDLYKILGMGVAFDETYPCRSNASYYNIEAFAIPPADYPFNEYVNVGEYISGKRLSYLYPLTVQPKELLM
jgi:hypothetical protein